MVLYSLFLIAPELHRQVYRQSIVMIFPSSLEQAFPYCYVPYEDDLPQDPADGKFEVFQSCINLQ